PAALLGGGALATAGALLVAWRTRKSRPGYLLVALAFLLPFLAIAAISTIKTIYHPRYSIPVSSGLYLSLAGLIAFAFQRRKTSAVQGLGIGVGVATSVVLVAGAAYGLDHLAFDGRYARDDYRGAIAYIRQAEQPGDTIVDNAIPPV